MTRCMEQIEKCVGGLDKRSTKFSRPIGQWIKVDDDHIQFLNSFIRAERRNLSNITEEEEEEEEKEEEEEPLHRRCFEAHWFTPFSLSPPPSTPAHPLTTHVTHMTHVTGAIDLAPARLWLTLGSQIDSYLVNYWFDSIRLNQMVILCWYFD